MSKRHTASRRRNYGRRQHELHERVDRRTARRADRDFRAGTDSGLDPLGYLESPSGQPYGFAD